MHHLFVSEVSEKHQHVFWDTPYGINFLGLKVSAFVIFLQSIFFQTASIFPVRFFNYSSKGKKHLHGDTPEVAPLQLSHN